MKTSGFTHLKIFISGIVLTVSLPLIAQQADTLKNLPNLLLPRFIPGVIKLKSGVLNKAILNYELVSQQIVFLQRNQTIVLRDPHLIDTVFLANRVFVPFEKGYLEVLAGLPDAALFRQHRAHFEVPGAQIGYGMTSRTATPQYYQQIYGPTGSIDVKVPEDYKVVDDSQYWIRERDKMHNFKTKSQFLKIFPGRKNEIEKFLALNKTDFKNSEDVKKLFLFCIQSQN